MIAKETIKKFNVVTLGVYSAGVQTGMGMPTGTRRCTTVLQTALKKVLSYNYLFNCFCHCSLTSVFNVVVLRGKPTECQQQRDVGLNFRSRDINVNRQLPQCKPDGSYDDVQCSAATGQCWCVYYNNLEIRGTRTNGKPSCPATGKTFRN